jgi:hypothetical protein
MEKIVIVLILIFVIGLLTYMHPEVNKEGLQNTNVQLVNAFFSTIKLNDGKSGVTQENIINNLNILNNWDIQTFDSKIQQFLNDNNSDNSTKIKNVQNYLGQTTPGNIA